MPMIVFRLLPEIFPDIWGDPEDKMINVGFGPDPFDPDGVMPIGQGYALSTPISALGNVGVNYANFTCMGCHAGGVVGPDGELERMVGAAGPLGPYFQKLHETVNDPDFTVDIFKDALGAKPAGWVYGDSDLLAQEIFERLLFQDLGGAAYFLGELKFASNASVERINATIVPYTYDVPFPPSYAGMPGSLDVFSVAAASLCDPDGTPACFPESIMPAAPGPADIPNVWRMANRENYQWDDSIGNLYFREVFASLSVTGGVPAAVNMDNVVLAAPFTSDLPAYPYPFDVDRPAAARGARIYRQACLGCHEPGNGVLMTPEETGTDPNRADALSSTVSY